MKNLIFKSQFVVLLAGLLTMCVTQVWGSVTETLTKTELTTNVTNTTCAYNTAKNYTDSTVSYVFYVNTDYVSRPWVQLKKDQGAYIKITSPENTKITDVTVTITSANNTSGGVADITKHTDYSGRIALLTADAAGSASMTGVAYTEDTISKNVMSLSPTGTNRELYFKVSVGARIWQISVTYESTIAPSATVTVQNADNGTITATPAGGSAIAEGRSAGVAAGTKVQLAAVADDGYTITHWVVKDASSQDVELDDDECFVMPASNVTVHAGFATMPTYTTIPEMYEAATGTRKRAYVTFNNWIVTGIRPSSASNNESVLITDGTNGFVLFGSDRTSMGFQLGDVLSGTELPCEIKKYNSGKTFNLLGITRTTPGLTVTPGGTETVKEGINVSTLDGVNTASVWHLNGWKYSSSAKRLTSQDESQWLSVFNWLNYEAPLVDGHYYDAKALFFMYKTAPDTYQKEVFFRQAEDIIADVTPAITLSNNNLAFGEVEKDNAKTLATINLGAQHLHGNVEVSIDGDGASYFSITSPSFPLDKGTGTIESTALSIQYAPTVVGLHTATIHFTTQDALEEKTITVTGTCVNMHNVAWKVNGVDYTEGTPSTSVAHGEQVTTLPTDPDVDCNDKSFVGWTATADYSHETVAPSDLFTDAAHSPAIGNNTTFYAAFADVAGGGGIQTNTITYETENIPSSYGAAADVVLNGMTFNVTQMHKYGEKMQWRAAGHSNGTGTMYNKTAIDGIQSIAITYTNDDTNKNFTIKVGDSENPTSGTEIFAAQVGETNTYIYDCSSSSPSYFVLTNGTNAGYLSSIVITYGGGSTYSNYTTICSCVDYSFHWNNVGSDWTKSCFADQGDNSWLADGIVVPTTTNNYYVGYQEKFACSTCEQKKLNNENAISENVAFKYMPVAYLQGANQGEGDNLKHAMAGAYGSVRIYDNSTNNNLNAGFIPAGYLLRMGTEGQSDWTSTNFATQNTTAVTFETDVVTIGVADASKKIYVGLWTGSTFDAEDAGANINNWSNGYNLSACKVSNGHADQYVSWGTLGTLTENKIGKFRFWYNNGNYNGDLHFVPYYNVTFKREGGEELSHTELLSCEGANVVDMTAPTLGSEETFQGWFEDAELTQEYMASTYDASANGSKIFYAKIQTKTYAITLNAGSGTVESESSKVLNLAKGDQSLPVAVPCAAAVAEGWVFAGWASSAVADETTKPAGLLEPAAGSCAYTVDGAATLHAVYKKGTEILAPTKYRIYAATSAGNKYMKGDPYASNTTVNQVAPGTQGEAKLYTFIAGTDANAGKTAIQFTNKSSETKYLTCTRTGSSGSYNYFLQASNVPYWWTISDQNTHGSKRISSGYSKQTLLYRAGTTNLFKMFNSDNVTNSGEYYDLEFEEYNEVISGAVYHSTPDCGAVQVTITLDKNTGSEDGSVTYTVGGTEHDDFSFTGTRTGYTLQGFNSTAGKNGAGGGTKVLNVDGSIANNLSGWVVDGKWTHTTASDRLFAAWAANKYTITLVANDGAEPATADKQLTATYDGSGLGTWGNFTRTGYTLDGYYTEAEGGVLVIDNDKHLVANVADYTGEGGIWKRDDAATLYAHWTANTYTLTLNQQGGEGGTEQVEVTYGAEMPTPIVLPEKVGFEFQGYYNNTNGAGTKYYNADGSSAATWNQTGASPTIYAYWTSVAYSASVELSGDIKLTSALGAIAGSATEAFTIHSDRIDDATAIRITYKDVTNDVLYPRSGTPYYVNSEFRLGNNTNYNFADETNIDVSALSGAYDATFTVRYQPTTAGQMDHYQIIVEVLRSTTLLDKKTLDVYGRALSDQFVVATNYNGMWYALPNNMPIEGTYDALPIGVDIEAMTAIAPSTAVYRMSTYKSDNYKPLRFIGTGGGLWGSNAVNGNGIRNWSTTENTNMYGWELTIVDWENGIYTMSPLSSTRNLNIYNLKWGLNGNVHSEEVHFLPITETVDPALIYAREWKANGLVFAYNDGGVTSTATYQIGSGAVTDAAIRKHSTGGVALYEITTTNLETSAGKLLRINMGTKVAFVTIPIIVASNKTTASSTPFTTIGTASGNYDVVVLGGNTLTTDAATSGAYKFNNMYIYPGATLVNATNANLSLNYLELRGGIKGIDAKGTKEQAVPYVYLGKQISQCKQGANLVMAVDVTHDYAVSVPFEVNLANVNYTGAWSASTGNPMVGAIGSQFRITRYNTALRASTGTGWEDITSGTMTPGVGYTMQAKRPSGQPYAYISFPLATNTAGVKAWADNENGEVAKAAVTLSNAGCGDDNVTDNNKGWNMLSDPFLAKVSYTGDTDPSAIVASLVKSTLEKHLDEHGNWTGTYDWVEYGSRRTWLSVPNDGFTEYTQVRAAEHTYEPCKVFFVQATSAGTVSFARSDRQQLSTPVRALMVEDSIAEPVIADFVVSHNNKQAYAGLTIDEQATAGYKFGEDQVLFETRSAVTYLKACMVVDGNYVVGNTLQPSEAEQLIPVEVYAPDMAGEYTFSIDEASDLDRIESMILYDYETGSAIDLMNGTYTFTPSAAGWVENRFALNVTLIKNTPLTPTDIRDSGDAGGRNIRKIIFEDKLYIIVDGQVYDATGKTTK